jgi:hypothetical protein
MMQGKKNDHLGAFFFSPEFVCKWRGEGPLLRPRYEQQDSAHMAMADQDG